MRKNQPDDLGMEGEGPPEDLSFAEVVENAARKLVTAIVISGGLVALAIYFQPSPPRYQATAADGRIVRVDTRTGTVIACEGARCYRVLRRGQELDERPAATALPRPVAREAQPAQAPAPAPSSNTALPAR